MGNPPVQRGRSDQGQVVEGGGEEEGAAEEDNEDTSTRLQPVKQEVHRDVSVETMTSDGQQVLIIDYHELLITWRHQASLALLFLFSSLMP